MSQLTRTIELYKTIVGVDWQGAYMCGYINVDDHLKDFVKDFEDDLEIELTDDHGALISSDGIGIYNKIHIKFLPPRKAFAFFAKNFDDYLSNYGFFYKQSDEFYIADIDGAFNKDGSSNKLIGAYCNIVELYELLLRVADHTETDDTVAHRHILLSVSGKDDIPVIYSNKDIVSLAEKSQDFNVRSLTEELFSKPHKGAKLSLFKRAISKYLSGNKDESKFPALIECFPEIVKSFRNNYELFLNEFSFDDEKETLEQKKQEYLLKLNEILNGIHGKLLAVPVSLVIVAGQMKPESEGNYFLINLIILAGAVVFALLMWMLTGNQLHSLLAVKAEYSSKKGRLKIELRESLYSELSSSFEQLDNRFTHQRWLIRFIDILVLLGLLFSFFVFEYHSKYIAGIL